MDTKRVTAARLVSVCWCLQMGIVGLPNVGKSTLFNTLTKLSIPAENFPFCTIEPNQVCLCQECVLRQRTQMQKLRRGLAEAPAHLPHQPQACT